MSVFIVYIKYVQKNSILLMLTKLKHVTRIVLCSFENCINGIAFNKIKLFKYFKSLPKEKPINVTFKYRC